MVIVLLFISRISLNEEWKGVTTIKVLYCFEYMIVENDRVDKLHMHANLLLGRFSDGRFTI